MVAQVPSIRDKACVSLILASASPRRADLLRSAGIDPVVAPVHCDETWHPGESPETYARRIAKDKAELAQRPGARILAADTTVWIDAALPPIGKPRDREEAQSILRTLLLAGQHQVTTAFAIVDTRSRKPRWHQGMTTTRVLMRTQISDALDRTLGRYLDTEEWRGKAGGYAIQGHAAGLVRSIEGSYTGVVGLPVAEVLDALDALDALDEDAPLSA
ncbi:MAG TPA: septum formation protein Maf [Nannocystis exedens]|nr:septum formation protein Maf [Nannocystis exedens]